MSEEYIPYNYDEIVIEELSRIYSEPIDPRFEEWFRGELNNE